MVAAAAGARPVRLRRPGALLRAPVPCGLPASRVAAPFPRRTVKISQLQLTAARFSKESDSAEDDNLLSELIDKWDAMENKSSLLLYGGGAILAFWISLVVVRALDSVPLLPGLLELVGLGYSGWFVYRYLLFQELLRTEVNPKPQATTTTRKRRSDLQCKVLQVMNRTSTSTETDGTIEGCCATLKLMPVGGDRRWKWSPEA